MAERNDFTGTDGESIRIEPLDPEVAAIRADIQQTRARMSHTVEDIGERLNPERLKEQLKSNIHDATIGKAEHMARVAVDRVDETRHSIMDSIRENPIPSAMVGIGLGWLFLSGRRHDRDHELRAGYQGGRTYRGGYGGHIGYPEDEFYGARAGMTGSYDRGTVDRARDRVSELADDARDLGGDIAHRAQDRVTDLASDVRDVVGDATDRAQDALGTTAYRAREWAGDIARETRRGGHRVEDRFEEALYDTPLAVGAVAVALGLAVGLTAPGTRRESELMGGARDQMMDRARGVVSEATEKVQDVAERVAEQAESTARNALEDEGFS
jgi:hypothetical protein